MAYLSAQESAKNLFYNIRVQFDQFRKNGNHFFFTQSIQDWNQETHIRNSLLVKVTHLVY